MTLIVGIVLILGGFALCVAIARALKHDANNDQGYRTFNRADKLPPRSPARKKRGW